MSTVHEAIVVGAGPAGLATSRELSRLGVEHVVLERGDGAGTTWANLYDSLTLTSGKHISTLPGMRHDASAPLFLPRAAFFNYLERYAERFRVPIVPRCDVFRAARRNGDWCLETSTGPVHARHLVWATGIASNPRVPRLPGTERFTGNILHTIDYRTPSRFAGRRVLIVGCGSSAGDIASELAKAGVDVTLAVRSGVSVVPRTIFGIPIQYISYAGRALPRAAQELLTRVITERAAWHGGPPVLPPSRVSPLDAPSLIGFKLVDAIRAGTVRVQGGIKTLTSRGVTFVTGNEQPVDDVILATGFSAAIAPLGGLAQLDDHGHMRRRDNVVSPDAPGLFVVGQRYEIPGALYNISQDAPRAARLIAARALRRAA